MKKFKYVLIKYILFIVTIIFACGYIFTKTAPKSSQMAKEEVLENVFGMVIKKDSIKEDSILAKPIAIDDKRDTTIITVPIEIVDKLVYAVIKVNGVGMRFLLDTGCSSLQITSAEYYYMLHLGVVSKDCLKDEVECTYADGSTNKCLSLDVDSVEFGGVKLKGVHTVIQENCNADLLLGQSVLSELGEVSIDYNNKVLKIKRK